MKSQTKHFFMEQNLLRLNVVKQIKSKHNPEVFLDFRQFRFGKYRQRLVGNPSIIDGSYLVKHDIGIRLQPFPGADPKSQRRHVVDRPAGERDDRCARVVGVIQEIALNDQAWPYLAGFRSLRRIEVCKTDLAAPTGHRRRLRQIRMRTAELLLELFVMPPGPGATGRLAPGVLCNSTLRCA